MANVKDKTKTYIWLYLSFVVILPFGVSSCMEKEINTDRLLIERQLTSNGRYPLPEYRIDAHYESEFGSAYTIVIPYEEADTIVTVLGIKREREFDYCFTSMLTHELKGLWKEKYVRYLAMDSVYLAFGSSRFWEHERFWKMHIQGLDPEDSVMIVK